MWILVYIWPNVCNKMTFLYCVCATVATAKAVFYEIKWFRYIFVIQNEQNVKIEIYMGYNLVLYTIHNISLYKWHRFCKSAFIISYSLFIFKGKNVNLKHKSTIHQIKVTVRHVKPLKSQEGMMPTPRQNLSWCLPYYWNVS